MAQRKREPGPEAVASKTVSVNGLRLAGADAGNYAVMLNSSPVLADVLRRP